MRHVLILFFLIVGFATTPALPAAATAISIYQAYIPEPILLEILEESCPHFGKCLPQMIEAYKAGSISITKVDSYAYEVADGGGNPIIIVIDSF